MTTSGVLTQPVDIVSPDAEMVLGSGWFPVETFGGASFRWVDNDAEILVATVHPVVYTLVLTLEPGPGVAVKAFDLEILSGGAKVATVNIKGKAPVKIALPSHGPAVQRLTLHVVGGGAKAVGDPRTLNFRVFSIALERGTRDILPAHMALGKGWFPLEKHAGKTFRWVDNDAEIARDSVDANDPVELDVEPGPGLGGTPFVLHLQRSDGSKIDDISIRSSLQRITIPWPAGEKIIRLHVESKGTKSPGDSRVLNFRVFAPA